MQQILSIRYQMQGILGLWTQVKYSVSIKITLNHDESWFLDWGSSFAKTYLPAMMCNT